MPGIRAMDPSRHLHLTVLVLGLFASACGGRTREDDGSGAGGPETGADVAIDLSAADATDTGAGPGGLDGADAPGADAPDADLEDDATDTSPPSDLGDNLGTIDQGEGGQDGSDETGAHGSDTDFDLPGDPDLTTDPDASDTTDLGGDSADAPTDTPEDPASDPDAPPDMTEDPDVAPDPDVAVEPDIPPVTDSFRDLPDDNPGDGACASIGIFVCTLRAAVQEANVNPGPDTIALAAGTYALDWHGFAEDLAATGDIDVLDDLTIVGQGADVTIITNSMADASFASHDGATLTLRNLSLSDGNQVLDVLPGSLAIMEDCSVRHNFNEGNAGAVEMNSTGNLQIRRCTFEGNSTAAHGGAVLTRGEVLIEDSTFIDNHAALTGGGFAQQFGSATIRNTTFSGNTTDGGGAGISMGGGTLSLNNVTLTDNIADVDGDGGASPVDNNGGGIAMRFDGTVTMRNTLVWGNSAGSFATPYPDCWGTVLNSNNNLIGDGSGCVGPANGVNGNQVGLADAGLSDLADNGGPTLTHALLGTSPAVGGGDDATCEAADQRGISRPQGDACDIGAYEWEPD